MIIGHHLKDKSKAINCRPADKKSNFSLLSVVTGAEAIMQIVVAVFGILFLGQSLATTVRYDNYRVYRVNVENIDQFHQLKSIENQYDFWKSGHVGQYSDIMVAPQNVAEFEKFVANLNSSLKVDNVQR